MPNSKSTRTANGRGTIRQRKDGLWEARFTVGFDPGTGKQKQRSVYGKTQKDVRKKLTAALKQLDDNSYLDADKRTLGQYLDEWLKEYIEPVRKPYTVDNYRRSIDLHIKPNLGAIRLQELRPEDIQRMVRHFTAGDKKAVSQRSQKPLSPKTIKNIIGVLSSALQEAVNNQIIPRNPAQFVKLPAVRQKEIEALTIEQIAAFVETAHSSPYYAPLACCLFLGLREGEALGLAWTHIDFEKRKITICQQLQREKVKGGKLYLMDSTKSGKSRVLDVPDFLMDIPKEDKRRQLLEQIAAGPAWCNEWGLCFTNKIGQPITPKALFGQFKKLATAAGIPNARVHDLRHTNATLALVNGDDVKTVQANMGHATAAFTLQRYVHATEQMKRDSANRMQQFFETSIEKKA